jgi:hypothetical protein
MEKLRFPTQQRERRWRSMWQTKEFDRTFAGDDESPKAKNAGTVAEIFQHVRAFGEFRKVIKALEAPIRTDDAEILLFLQATGCKEAVGLGATGRERARRRGRRGRLRGRAG